MHIKIPHKTTKNAATEKVKQALREARPLAAQNNVTIDEERWEGETLRFAVTLQGKKINGQLEVSDMDFTLDAKLPLLWRMFEGRIEKMIAEQVKQLG